MGLRASRTTLTVAIAPLALAGLLLPLTGCGLPAVPQPPSLKLPEQVTDLAAVRTGNSVHLTWTMPKRTTDKVLLKGGQAVHVCRKFGNGACMVAGDIRAEAAKPAEYTDQLPADLTSGSLRLLAYEIELRSPAGRTAGPSNVVYTVAGPAPPPVNALSVDVRADGVLLRWQKAAAEEGEVPTIRIHRELVPPPNAPSKAKDSGVSAGVKEPLEQTLEVAGNPEMCLDRDASYDKTYRYSVQRKQRVSLGGHAVELLGSPSDTVSILTRDTFPPAVPAELAAVPDPAEKVIDLSWVPDTEKDLAGYIVYRRDVEPGAAVQRVSPAKTPVVPPSFRDTAVQPGKRYAYSVSAVDNDGNESTRSAEVEEILPNE